MQLKVVVITCKLQWENEKDETNMKEKMNKKNEKISLWGTLHMTVREYGRMFLPFTDSMYKELLKLGKLCLDVSIILYILRRSTTHHVETVDGVLNFG